MSDEPMEIHPWRAAPDSTVVVPGSKSITNRALICAAQARGVSRLTGVLRADDTEAMIGAIRALGAEVIEGAEPTTLTVHGSDRLGEAPCTLDARQSGTTGRFVLPLAASGSAPCTLDGHAQLRGRPFGPLIDAVRSLGATVDEIGDPGTLPLVVTGPLDGGRVALRGDLSSQFLSGLLLAGPSMKRGLDVSLTSPLVSASYVEMTTRVMASFGAYASGMSVASGSYRAAEYTIEPDASAASYFFAAAAITGGHIVVEGLGSSSLQGDLAFVKLLGQMGADVSIGPARTEVSGTGELHGLDVDMSDCSDTAPTLAVVAAFASSPTTVRGIGFIRAKESDRIAAVVRELARAGVQAREDPDGFTITPTTSSTEIHGARLSTYDDHRMAMSLALLGLVVPGIVIENPRCVAKTFPDYFTRLAAAGH